MIQAIYTDGACKNNPGPGGWSAIFILEPFQNQRILVQNLSISTENISKDDISTENISSKIIESLKLLLKEENYPHMQIKNCKISYTENGGENTGENSILLEIGGNEASTTNNRMEMIGVIQALRIAQKINFISNNLNGNGLSANDSNEKSILLFTDSTYVKNGIEQWIHKWKTNNWKTSQKSPVKNQDLWIQMSNYNDSMNVKWNWVKGHSGNELNDIADSIARCMAELI